MSAEDDELPNLVDDAPTATTGEEEELDSDDDVSTLAPEDRLARALAAKDKGNGAFKAKDEAGAVKEYKYGVGMLEGLNEANTGEEQVKALLLSLHNNLSMVHFKLGEYGEATKQGSAALTIDPQNVKGLYRRGAARRKAGELKEAKADLSACLKLDAANKEAKAQLRGVLKDLEEEKKKYAGFLGKGGGLYGDREKERAQRDQEKKVAAATKKRQEEEKKRQAEVLAAEELKARRKRWEDICVERMVKHQHVQSYEEWDAEEQVREAAEAEAKKAAEKAKKEKEKKEKEAARRAKEAAEPEVVDDEELDASLVRGYKTTSDGRRTSYFNNELDEKSKALIGDITPQKIGAGGGGGAATPPPAGAGGAAAGGAAAAAASAGPQKIDPAAPAVGVSAWNKAGTWEEKDMTDWMTPRVSTALAGTEVGFDGGMAEMVAVKDVEGSASIAQVRGKRRHIFDLSFNVEVRLTMFGAGDAAPRTIGGAKLVFTDVAGDNNGEHETQLETAAGTSVADRRSLEQWVAHTGQGLRPALIAKLDGLIAEYRAL